MSVRTLNVGLLLAFLCTLALHALARRDPARPNLEFLPEMVRSAAYHSFTPNPAFADGKTLQLPAPDTVPRDHLPLHYRATPEDALRAGKELRNPFAPTDAAARRRGAAVFSVYCQVCHGPGGKGDGPVALRGVPPPPSLLAEHALKMAEGQMFHVLTYGQGNMASYAGLVSREDRWRAVLHVRDLQKRALKMTR
jgi:mono/diheme cytochrome c family protein